MVQTILTGIIVFTAGIIALIRFIRFFTSPLKKCGGCSQNCGSCSLEEFKKVIELKRVHPDL